jgi:quercetin dioxygenase-like cupin family protein
MGRLLALKRATRYGAGVRTWNLLEIEAPDGVRTPTVLHSGDGRAIALRLEPGQMLGDHQVRERAWLTVVDGEVEVSCGDVTATAGTGTLLMFDPAERHSVSSTAGARLLLLLAPWPADGHYGEDETSAQVSPAG